MDWLKKIDFAMTTDTGKVTFTFVLFAMILGFIISWIAIYCNKKIMGAFARAAMNAGAIDEDSAKTLAELEQENNVSAINAMRRGGALSKMVTAVGAERDERECSRWMKIRDFTSRRRQNREPCANTAKKRQSCGRLFSE